MILKDIINKFDKSNIKAGDGLEKGNYPLYTCSPVVNKFLNDYLYDDEAIIISTGGNFAAHYVKGRFNYSTDCYVFNTDKYNLKYLYYYLLSKSDDVNKMFRGAGLKHLNKNEFVMLNIKEIPLNEQDRIVNQLDKINEMIKVRKKEIDKCNNLIKSQFVEMFENKDYSLKTLDSISLKKGEYGAGSASIPYNCNRPRYVRITDINEDGTLNNDCVSSIEENDDITYKLEYGDFMFARMGATVGKTYAFEKGNQIFAGYLIRFKLNIDIVNPKYLFWFTKTTKYNEWVKLNQSGAAQPGINAKKYGSLEIPIPPIELQNKFAQIVEQIDKQKFEFEKSLKKLEELQASLMQEYFG